MTRTVPIVGFLLWASAVPGSVLAAQHDPATIASLIDSRLASWWQADGVQAAPMVDDATFLRRASLDLIGRIPTTAEVRQFLATPSPDKRAKLVQNLIHSGGHTRHMATYWRRTWIPQADTDQFEQLADDFELWIARRMQETTRYDRIVFELLTLPTSAMGRPSGTVSPGNFYTANENKPESLAANVTRAFLGLNLDCAQCHNHPFSRWTRDQFWQTAAFFAPAKVGDDGNPLPPEVTIPNTTSSLSAELLDDAKVTWPKSINADTGRRLLADWITARKNPYFARNAVNHLWAHMFGTALVEPLDDLSNEASSSGRQAELLQDLADQFEAGGYNLQDMTQALVITKAYQLSSLIPEGRVPSPTLFARMPVRGLTGEQLYESLVVAGLSTENADDQRNSRGSLRQRFVTQFYVGRPLEAERSITQALSMMNGRITTEMTDPDKNQILAGVISAPFLNTKAKVETLGLAVLGRHLSAQESQTLVNSIEGTTIERGLADLLWVLINTTEFHTNH